MDEQCLRFGISLNQSTALNHKTLKPLNRPECHPSGSSGSAIGGWGDIAWRSRSFQHHEPSRNITTFHHIAWFGVYPKRVVQFNILSFKSLLLYFPNSVRKQKKTILIFKLLISKVFLQKLDANGMHDGCKRDASWMQKKPKIPKAVDCLAMLDLYPEQAAIP